MKETENGDKIPNLLSVRMFAEQFPAFSQGSLRALIWNEDFNGLKEDGVILRIGKKKLLIDVDKFFKWIKKQNHIVE
ncbi:MAG: DNA-binding protein [Alphaproteobacteria bacterium]|jgi:hypothetical protein|nr:DNA-binding protein [Alphaproteobacteria bacterium]